MTMWKFTINNGKKLEQATSLVESRKPRDLPTINLCPISRWVLMQFNLRRRDLPLLTKSSKPMNPAPTIISCHIWTFSTVEPCHSTDSLLGFLMCWSHSFVTLHSRMEYLAIAGSRNIQEKLECELINIMNHLCVFDHGSVFVSHNKKWYRPKAINTLLRGFPSVGQGRVLLENPLFICENPPRPRKQYRLKNLLLVDLLIGLVFRNHKKKVFFH